MIDEGFYLSVLETNKDALRETVRDAMLAGVRRQFEWEIPDAIKKAVNDFILEEIVPQVRAELTANKDTFVDAATDMVRGVPAEIGKAMQEALAKNLTQSWTLRKVVEACFQ